MAPLFVWGFWASALVMTPFWLYQNRQRRRALVYRSPAEGRAAKKAERDAQAVENSPQMTAVRLQERLRIENEERERECARAIMVVVGCQGTTAIISVQSRDALNRRRLIATSLRATVAK